MELLLDPIKPPLNLWNKNRISPGAVGTVGDVLIQTKLKHSSPDMPERYEAWNSKVNSVFYGSNVQDGTSESFTSEGLGARVVQRPIHRYTGYKTAVGWKHQDIVPTDRKVESKMAGLPQFGWNSLVASVERTKTSGDRFLPLPRGYGASALTRGNQYPLIAVRTTGVQKPEGTRLLDQRFAAPREEKDIQDVVVQTYATPREIERRELERRTGFGPR